MGRGVRWSTCARSGPRRLRFPGGPRPARAQDTARPTGEAWQIIPLPQSSLVYARDLSLIGEIGREWRTSIPIGSLPAYVPAAFVAIEDQRFYQHDGVDLKGVAAAAVGKILGKPRGGADRKSTRLNSSHLGIS